MWMKYLVLPFLVFFFHAFLYDWFAHWFLSSNTKYTRKPIDSSVLSAESDPSEMTLRLQSIYLTCDYENVESTVALTHEIYLVKF